MVHPVDERVRELARDRFGFSRLRPGQLRAASAAAEGRDVLAVLPTGGGKSAIYELAGLLRSGPTIVVSPLIALQDDQLAHLRATGLEALVLNSHQSAREHAASLAAASGAGTPSRMGRSAAPTPAGRRSSSAGKRSAAEREARPAGQTVRRRGGCGSSTRPPPIVVTGL